MIVTPTYTCGCTPVLDSDGSVIHHRDCANPSEPSKPSEPTKSVQFLDIAQLKQLSCMNALLECMTRRHDVWCDCDLCEARMLTFRAAHQSEEGFEYQPLE